jgi:DNA-directed RNA polymerase specialized sigma24 family protein
MSELAKDTRLESHLGLIHKLCFKVHKRTAAMGLSLDYEDLFQEACIAWMNAAKKFDPDAGFYFSTYLGRSVLNRLNGVVESTIKTEIKCGGASLDDPISEDGSKLADVVPDDSVDLLGSVMEWDARRKVMGRLSPMAEWSAFRVLQEKNKALGKPYTVTKELNIAWLGRHFLIPMRIVNSREWDAIRMELNREAGV